MCNLKIVGAVCVSCNARCKEVNIDMRSKLCFKCDKKRYCVENGIMCKSFYEGRLTQFMSKKTIKKMGEIGEDDYIEYYAFCIENKTDNCVEYTECFLLEYTDGYIPVIVPNINTSSYYALERHGMKPDYEDEEFSIHNIISITNIEYRKPLIDLIRKIETKWISKLDLL